jgi:hypothetical protein
MLEKRREKKRIEEKRKEEFYRGGRWKERIRYRKE